MDSGRNSRSKGGRPDPLWDLLEDLKANPIPGVFSSSPRENCMVLQNWWLVSSSIEGESKTLAVAGYVVGKESKIPFTSAPIVKRIDSFTLETADGATVKVEGMINHSNTQNNGFSLEVCQRFNIGFPLFWEQYVGSCVDKTPITGTSTSRFLKEFVIGARNISSPNLAASDHTGLNDEIWGDSPGSGAKENEPAHEDKEAAVTLEKVDGTSKEGSDTRRRRGRPKNPNKSQTDDKEPQSRSNSRGKKPLRANIEEPEGFATPEKDDTSSSKKLQTARRRKDAVAKVAKSKVPDMSQTGGKGSSKKDHVTESRDKTSGKGRQPRAKTEVCGATSSPPLSESNIRRSRSGRAVIPPVDRGSQTVVYDQNGSFAGVATTSTPVSRGSTPMPSRKKKRS